MRCKHAIPYSVMCQKPVSTSICFHFVPCRFFLELTDGTNLVVLCIKKKGVCLKIDRFDKLNKKISLLNDKKLGYFKCYCGCGRWVYACLI